MEDVTVQEPVNTPAETTASTSGEVETQTPATPASQPTVPESNPAEAKFKSQIENLTKALKAERARSRAALREGSRGGGVLEGAEENYDVFSHPEVQRLLLQNAEFQLKEGVSDILSQFPSLPKEIATAIKKNPRGFVQTDTTDVPNALLDIQEYVEEVIGALEAGQLPPQPKNVPIASNNAQPQANSQDINIQKILAKPPEEWTDEESKLVANRAEELRKGRG